MSPFPDRNFTETARIPAPRGLKQENLPPDLTRYYRVKAIDADGLESEWSDVVCGTTNPCPPRRRAGREWKKTARACNGHRHRSATLSVTAC